MSAIICSVDDNLYIYIYIFTNILYYIGNQVLMCYSIYKKTYLYVYMFTINQSINDIPNLTLLSLFSFIPNVACLRLFVYLYLYLYLFYFGLLSTTLEEN